MPIADAIRKYGFRRWYERQLIESHAYLLTAFLALILLLSGIEAMDSLRRSPLGYGAILLIAAGAGTLMLICWRRFSVLLARAELFANDAECPQCKAWGKFAVVATEASSEQDPPEAGRPHWLSVSCSKCGERWTVG
jgi:hypothetical protein